MKNLLTFIIVLIVYFVFFLLSYLLGAFVDNSFNLTRETRFVIVIVFAVIFSWAIPLIVFNVRKW